MRPGKIPPALMHRHIFSHLGVRRPDVLVHARLGEDSAVIDFGAEVCVVTTDPITGASRHMGWLAVHIGCNDLAANGARPVGVLVTIMARPESAEEELAAIMAEAHQACLELGIEVLGGHTEVTPGLPQTIISLTAIGRAPKDRFVTSAGAQPGDAIILTKSAGLEGTAILATDFEAELRGRLPDAVIEKAQALRQRLSVVPEGLLAASAGATALHDVTEGGVIGGLWELAEAAQVGMEVWAESIPVLPETEALCQYFAADPWRLISSGAMLIAARDGEDMVRLLAQNSIPAAVIGRVLAPGQRRLMVAGQPTPLEPPDRDELWRILERHGVSA